MRHRIYLILALFGLPGMGVAQEFLGDRPELYAEADFVAQRISAFLAGESAEPVPVPQPAPAPSRVVPAPAPRQVDHLAAARSAEAGGDRAVAIRHYRALLARDPQHHFGRLELARLLHEENALEESRAEFVRVSNSNPPPEVQRNIDAFVDNIDRRAGRRAAPARQKRSDAALRVSVGVFHDDNVNFGPSTRLVEVAPLNVFNTRITELEVNEPSRPQGDDGFSVELTGALVHDVGERGDWGVALEGDYFETWLSDEADWETRLLEGRVALRHVSDRRMVNLPVKFGHIAVGGEDLVTLVGVQPSLTYQAAADDGHWRSYVNFEQRDYDRAHGRDGLHLGTGASRLWITEDERSSWTFGGEIFHEDTDDSAFTNYGAALHVGVSQELTDALTFFAQGEVRREWYDEREDLAPEDRIDDLLAARVGLHLAITKQYGLELGYQHVTNRSSFDIYAYDRNVLSLNAQASF